MNETHKELEGSRRTIILFVAAAYGFLLVDTLFEHHAGLVSISYQKWIPIIFSPLGLAVAVAAGLSGRRVAIQAFQGLLLASAFVGLLGTYFHFRPFLENISLLAVHQVPPKLAPLLFVGVGMLGLLATYKVQAPSRRDKHTTETPIFRRDLKARLTEATLDRD